MSDPVDRLNAALQGRYRIDRELGEGGMATVYLADDLKHERKVALKLLKPELAAVVGAERFLAEIRTTANLQHPHILPLFDSGEADGFLFYVMPYVDGESLADRLDRERELPVEEAVSIAVAVAGALQAAHDSGVIHRDIKPANILLSGGGPLVADFGIAVAVGAAGGDRLTRTGLAVGTPQYMSPEQAIGDRPVGPASDIYALGCVLYEMLVGEPPHTGGSAQVILGKIITGETVSPRKARASVPANVDAAIRRALERLPADRFLGANQFATALRDPSFVFEAPGEAAAARARPGGLWNPLSVALAVLVGILTTLMAWPEDGPVPTPLTVTPVAIPAEQRPVGMLEVTPDGRLLVYEGPEEPDAPLLAFHRVDGISIPIAGTQGGKGPAIGPDGDLLAFIRESSIRVVSASGGTARTVVDLPGACCLRWDSEGRYIYFTEADGNLARVRATGGGVETVAEVDRGAGDRHNGWFAAVPGGTYGLYQAAGPADLESRILLLELETGETREVVKGKFPRLVGGALLFVTQGRDAVMAVPFDTDQLRPAGPPVRVAEGLADIGPQLPRLNPVPAAVSQEGVLWYRTGPVGQNRQTPVWVTREGDASPVDSMWTGRYYSVSLSPDGARLLTDGGIGGCCIYVRTLPHGPTTHISVPEAWTVYRGSWAPPGDTILFAALSSGFAQPEAYITAADGSGTPTLLDLEAPHAILSPDGTWVVARTIGVGPGRGDVIARRRDGGDVIPLVATDSAEVQPALSPDGRFLAYASNASGRFEVYVRPFPDADRWVTQVSVAGGGSPVWGRTGRELFYLSADEHLVAARIETASGFTVESREVLFSVAEYYKDSFGVHYDLSPDDQRFVMLRRQETSHDDQLIVLDDIFGLMRAS